MSLLRWTSEMQSRVFFHRLAYKEFVEASHWYADRSIRSSLRFCAQVEAAIQRIAKRPGLLPIYAAGFRYVRVERFPYLLIFRERSANQVEIVAVAHTSRRPGYWRRRK